MMADHALWSEDDEVFLHKRRTLATQHVKILLRRPRRRLHDHNIVVAGELQITFDAGAGMFLPLTS